MKKFSIDLKASDKGERKKVVKYLKSKGLKFCDLDRWKPNKRWRYIYKGDKGFCYTPAVDTVILILPRDWDKLIEYTKKDCNITSATLKPFPGQEHGIERIIVKPNPCSDSWLFRSWKQTWAKKLIKEAQELGEQFQKDLLEANRQVQKEKLHTVQLTKPELLKCISYLVSAKRKTCSAINHEVLGSVICKLNKEICQ